MFKKGLSANIKKDVNTFQNDPIGDPIEERIKVGRVIDIILNDKYPKFKKYGGDSAIGTIKFKPINFATPGESFAKPFFPNISSLPLVNEIVLIFKLPGNNINKAGANESFYYINSINLWNTPHHNAFPEVSTLSKSTENQQSYSQVEEGNPGVNSDKLKQINLNSPVNKSQRTFIEKSNIHPLLPFPGDNIYQGRFGNSIRLGSTNVSEDEALKHKLNEWSQTGSSGDPITIVRNGQPDKTEKPGYKHIIEEVNKDLTSIYLTSTQTIPIDLASENFRSFSTKKESINYIPIKPKDYNSPQTIITSDRIIANAKKDSILLSAQKSVSLSTNNTVNINTKSMIVDAGNIRLGSIEANESVVKGDTLYFQLNSLLKALIQMTSILKTSQIWPGGVPAADIPRNQIYDDVNTQLKLIQEDLETMLSKTVKTV